MPQYLWVREGALGPLVLPLQENGVAYPSGASPTVTLVLQGLDGKLAATLIDDSARVFWLDDSGDVNYTPLAGELLAAASPYRAYVRIYSTTGSYIDAPSGDWFSIQVAPSGF